MKWTPEESATAKAFDSSKEKDTREESVMGQEKSAVLALLLANLLRSSDLVSFSFFFHLYGSSRLESISGLPFCLSFCCCFCSYWWSAPILPHHQLSTEMWSKWQFRAFTLLQSSSFTIMPSNLPKKFSFFNFFPSFLNIFHKRKDRRVTKVIISQNMKIGLKITSRRSIKVQNAIKLSKVISSICFCIL